MTLSRQSVSFVAFSVVCCNLFLSEIAVGALVSNVNNRQPAREGIRENNTSLRPQSDTVIYVGNIDWKLPIDDVSGAITRLITTKTPENDGSTANRHNGGGGSFEVKIAELTVPRRARDEGKFHRGSAEVIFSSPQDARIAMETLRRCSETATSSGGSSPDAQEWKIRWAFVPGSSPRNSPKSGAPITSLSRERIDHRKKRAAKYARKRTRVGETTDRAIESLLANLCQADRDLLVGQGTPVLEAPLLDWSACPDEIDPMGAGRIKKGTQRGERKRAAVEAFLEVARGLLVIPDAEEQNGGGGDDNTDKEIAARDRPGRTVADLGCGAGNLTVPLAWWLKQLGFDVLGVDINDQALALLSKRADRLGIEIRTLHQDLLKLGSLNDHDIVAGGGNSNDDGCPSMSMGGNELSECAAVVSLHACGAASDLSMAAAVRNNLPFAVSPCCIGKISTERRPAGRMLPRRSLTSAERSAAPTAVLSYPRSAWLSKALPSQDDYRLLAAAADYGIGNSDKGDVDDRELARRKRCRLSKKIIEVDRLQWAKENGYCVRLLEMPRIGPLYPKRELLLGAKEGSHAASKLLQLPTVL